MIGELIYLASPYNHKKKFVRQKRYEYVRDATMKLMQMNIVVYSPIVHMHHIDLISEFPREWEFYKKFDEVMLSRCNKLWILDIAGWDESRGICGEMKIANDLNIPISLVNFNRLLNEDTLLASEISYVGVDKE